MELTLERRVDLSPPKHVADAKSGAPKLQALTSLRFFAAAMLVVFHSAPQICPEWGDFVRQKLTLNQGVSFFYVLSGFILTYVYPNLQGRESIVKFLRARIARVYPVYVVAFLLCVPFAALPIGQCVSLGALYLAMLQDWIPVRASYWSFNAPGWSISCEFFFYLVFPLLVARFGSTFRWKLAICAVLAAAMIAIGCLLPAPANTFAPSPVWFSSLCPAVRLLEFAIGMCTALLFMKTQCQFHPPQFSMRAEASQSKVSQARATARDSGSGRDMNVSDMQAPVGRPILSGAPRSTLTTSRDGSAATCAEVLAICATIAYSIFTANCAMPFLPDGIRLWLSWAGGAPIYACLIYLFARQAGHCSRALSAPFFVYLGEISYSVYLLHYVLLYYVASENCASLPSVAAVPLYWMTVMCASYLCYEVIEKPCRLLIGSGNISSYVNALRKINFRAAVTTAAFFALSIGAFYNAYDPLIAPFLVHSIAAKTAPPIRNTKFGNAFLLRGVELERGRDKSCLKIAWKALADTPLKYKVGVHLIASDGKVIFRDFPQSRQTGVVRAGNIWVNQRPLETALINKTARIGICLYEVVNGTVKLQSVEKGPRDCADSRLLVDL